MALKKILKKVAKKVATVKARATKSTATTRKSTPKAKAKATSTKQGRATKATAKKTAANRTTAKKVASRQRLAGKPVRREHADAGKRTNPASASSVRPNDQTSVSQKGASDTDTALSVGAAAPHFELEGSDGARHALRSYRGRPVVLFFYPKDNTPGCTREACDFRDNLARATSAGAVVLGVSRDSLASHARFKDKYQLNFPLLSDPELTAHTAYGTWGKKSLYGRVFDGTIRSTFLIDKEGRISRVWPKVSITGHVDEVLNAVSELS